MHKSTKTVALVANSTWNIFNFRLNVVDKFLEEGWKVIVFAPVDEYLEYKEHYPKVKHINLRTLDRDSKNPLKDIAFTLELIRKYTKFKPDLVIHYTNKPNIFGGIAAWISGKKSVAVVTGLGYAFIRTGWIRTLTTFLYQLSAKGHQRFIFENEEDKALFNKIGIINDKRSIAVKGCGVDLQYYYPMNGIEPHDRVVFTFIGRLLYDKGIREFVEAAKLIKPKYKHVDFWIVGEMDPENPATIDKEDLIDWINNDLIVYHGFQRDVRSLISESDCVVLPSYREGMPRIIMEAMAMSKPIITTDAPGCRETVDDRVNGFTIPIRNANKLSEAIENMIGLSHENRRKMGAAGRDKAAKEFDSKKIAEELFDITTSLDVN